jgi:hypothetical protein
VLKQPALLALLPFVFRTTHSPGVMFAELVLHRWKVYAALKILFTAACICACCSADPTIA